MSDGERVREIERGIEKGRERERKREREREREREAFSFLRLKGVGLLQSNLLLD